MSELVEAGSEKLCSALEVGAMPDVFSDLESIEDDVVTMIANLMETRAKIPSQQAMTNAYLDQITFPPGARVIELGCGSGPVCRAIADRAEVGEVIGLEPSSIMLEHARSLNSHPNIAYEQGDAYDVNHGDGAFDVVVLHTLLTHLDDPGRVVAEARRLVSDNGWLAVCDGDFSTTTVSICAEDPLQRCVDAFVEANVTNPYLVRGLSALVTKGGFTPGALESFGQVETTGPGLTTSWVDRGSEVLSSTGRITPELADAYRSEAVSRTDAGTWFGYMAYATLLARPA